MSVHLWVIVAAATAGVLLPKVLPSLVMPERLPDWVSGWLEYLPASILGAFTALAAGSWALASPHAPVLVLAIGVIAAMAYLLRRTFISLLVGTAVLVVLHLAGLG